MELKTIPKPPELEIAVKPEANRLELAFPALITGFVLILTSLPYLCGYLRAPQAKTFIGIMLDVPDTTQYWAWMREMGQAWFISNPLTSEPNDPVYFNLLWGLEINQA